ncbi:unnamed protein product, partial [Prorocentrum cordatum]
MRYYLRCPHACAKLVAAVKAAQNSADSARNFLAARQREAKEPSARETVTTLQKQLADVSKRLAESKKQASAHESKFVVKRVLFQAGQVISAFEEELKKATDVCAPLLEEAGLDFLVANSATTLASVLREHAAEKDLTEEGLFQQIGGTSEEAFSAWLAALPEKIGREEVSFDEDRRRAVFRHLDASKSGAVSLENWKDMFKRRFTCVKQIAVTDVFEISKSKTTSKIEIGEVLEATGLASTKTDEGGMTRIECRVLSSDTAGFVTIKGNEGTTYLEEVTPFKTCSADMDKALVEAGKVIGKADNFLTTKSKELASGPGPMADARAELTKLRPKVSKARVDFDALKKKLAAAKTAFLKKEAEEKNAHVVAKEKKQADAVMDVAKAKVDPMEASAQKLEEAAKPLTGLTAAELEAFASPASTLE